MLVKAKISEGSMITAWTYHHSDNISGIDRMLWNYKKFHQMKITKNWNWMALNVARANEIASTIQLISMLKYTKDAGMPKK